MSVLAAAIVRGILADRPAVAAAPTCFACGRSYGRGAPKADGSGPSRFCSVRCRDAFDAGMPPYDPQPHRTVARVLLTSWVTVAGPPGAVGRRPYARDLPVSGGGCLISCRSCRRDFVSKGLRCCSPECERAYREKQEIAATMAEVGAQPIAGRKRFCEAPGCGKPIPLWRKGRKVSAATKFCSPACGQRARKSGGPLSASPNPVWSVESAQKPPSNGLSCEAVQFPSGSAEAAFVTLPVNLVGGGSFRFAGAELDPQTRRAVAEAEFGGGGGAAALGVVPDAVYAGMYRVRRPDGTLSDLLGLSRACELARRLTQRRAAA